jgi:chromosome segregation ATPase
MDERTRQLSEEIGELRSMIMERERSFDKIKTDFDRVKDTVSGLEPTKLTKNLEKKETEIMQNEAKIEKLEALVKALSEENSRFRSLMSKIKSFENLVDISYNIDRKLSEIKGIKDYADKIASKSENVFSELNRKVSELESQKEKIKKIDELTMEMTKMLDEVTLKLTKFVKKKDLKEFDEDYKEKFEKFKTSLKTELNNLKTESSAKQQPTEAKTEIPELNSRIAKLKSVVDAQNSIVKSIIDRLDKAPEKIEIKPDAGLETRSIRNIKLSLRFFQILNILPYVREQNKVKEYISEMREIIGEMKSVGLWDPEKDSLMNNIFARLSKGFDSQGLKELGKIYSKGINA